MLTVINPIFSYHANGHLNKTGREESDDDHERLGETGMFLS